jgi:hypothetical protein
MTLQTKIVLSDKELEMIRNADWILTKQSILEKVDLLLKECVPVIEEKISFSNIPVDIPKISKGENYLGLPYLILDHPRIFDKHDIFAIRTMFWWGRFYSITLHLAGKYKTMLERKIVERSEVLHSKFYLCIHDEQWHHHFEPANYLPFNNVSSTDLKKIINEKAFIKIAIKFPIQGFDEQQKLLTQGYDVIGKLIN